MTLSEENYLKSLFHLENQLEEPVSTNAIAEDLETKASSVTDMIKRLSKKDYLKYKRYQGANLTQKGREHALKVIRKHRLWETFLVEKLNFNWDEVHEIAEELEHIHSEKLTDCLDEFLDFPDVDPHGDPIPDKTGHVAKLVKKRLVNFKENTRGICVGVDDSSSAFLQYLDKNNIHIGQKIHVLNIEEFDGSMLIETKDEQITISQVAANNIYLKPLND